MRPPRRAGDQNHEQLKLYVHHLVYALHLRAAQQICKVEDHQRLHLHRDRPFDSRFSTRVITRGATERVPGLQAAYVLLLPRNRLHGGVRDRVPVAVVRVLPQGRDEVAVHQKAGQSVGLARDISFVHRALRTVHGLRGRWADEDPEDAAVDQASEIVIES